MIKCAACGHENLEGTIICTECGEGLTEDIISAIRTRALEENDVADISIRPSMGTATFTPGSKLRISIQGVEPVIVHPNPEVTLGRYDQRNEVQPNLDLTPFAAYRLGVSRQHAALRAEGGRLYVVDLNSSNGTLLNGQPLVARQPYILHDGDEVCLGRMVMRVYFE